MELRQLEYFVAVAEEANFTRAAERVHISQSGISAQVRQLENELGAALIDRSNRKAALTVAGKAALVHARDALAAAASLRQAVDEVTTLIRGRFHVGMVTACTVPGLFDSLSAFHTAHPGVEIALTENNSDRLIEQVRAGELDLALVGTAAAPPSDLESLPIISEPLTALVPAGHALAGRGTATLSEIVEFPVVCMPDGTGIRTVFDRGCSALGIHADIALVASAPDAMADLATRGLGVVVLSRSMAGAYPQLHPVVIDDVDIPAVLSLVWSSGKSPALREFLVHARRSFT
ncbi:LysR family transcriptional regulator [Rhodococcus sp. NPDC058521]|uniref:LysR family transcriptional regulator n=1 Tax=Rhodococcus sp. NPDC058521 TaxID=3346536 RepID=UPI00364AF617